MKLKVGRQVGSPGQSWQSAWKANSRLQKMCVMWRMRPRAESRRGKFYTGLTSRWYTENTSVVRRHVDSVVFGRFLPLYENNDTNTTRNSGTILNLV